MYRQIFTPTEQNNTVTIPRKWYGKEVEVIVSPFDNNSMQISENNIADKTNRLQEIRSITKDVHIDLTNFHFDRNEANDYD
jgi:hypothetical protein